MEGIQLYCPRCNCDVTVRHKKCCCCHPKLEGASNIKELPMDGES